ncbi:MAG: hypothetical protein Q4E34_02715 [Synergistaceae bacterium]|nr:hypothetical protein [Synergistaceae bacterium]
MKNTNSGSDFGDVFKDKASAVFLYVLFAVLIIFTLSHKAAYFQDELLSYCLANNNEVEVKMNYLAENVIGNETRMKIAPGVPYIPASSAFARVNAVPQGGRFNYANVWKNQADDTHPPLYYTLLHTVCSFFPGAFSMWFAGVINLLFALGILFVSRKLVRQLTDSKFILSAVSLMLVFSSAMLNSFACLRMYVMATFFVTLQTYLFLKQTDQDITHKFCVRIAVVTFLGALTHYYCVFYMVLLSIVFGIQRLCGRDRKGTAYFSAAQICGGLAACAVFPAIYTHIFHGARGTSEFMPNVMSLADYPLRLSAYWQTISGELFGNMLLPSVAAAIFAAVYAIKKDKVILKDKIPPSALKKYMPALISVTAYFLIVSKLTPILNEGVYGDIKYMYPIFAVCLCVISAAVFTVLDSLLSGRIAKCLTVFLALSVTAGSWLCTDWNSRFLYGEYRQHLFTQQLFGDSDCLCFYINLIPKDMYYLSHYRSLTIFPVEAFSENIGKLRALLADQRTNKLVICIARQNGINTDVFMEQLNPEIQNYNISRTPLGRSEGDEDGNIYHLQRISY